MSMPIELLKKYKESCSSTEIVSVQIENKTNPKLEELRKINEVIDEIKTIISEVVPVLDSSCSKYVQMLNELVEEKKRNNQEKLKSQQQINKKKSSKKKSSKKMYNKIAGLCHPDKTDDEELHEKFMKAKELLEEGDDYGLFEIYKEFDDDAEDENYYNIDVELGIKQTEYLRIRSSNTYKIVVIYKSGETKKAKSIYLKQIMEKIQELEAEQWD